MSIQSAVLFDHDGKPTYVLISQARSKSAAKPLEAAIRCVDQGQATDYFTAWWNVAFPTRNVLPSEPIANPDGTGTLAFWQVFT